VTTRPGAEWGAEVSAPIDTFEVGSDAQLAAVLTGTPRRLPLVRGGDLHRSLGSPATTTPTARLPIDLIAVTVNGERLTAVAHILVRRRGRLGWWRGPIVAVMNADHVGSWDAAPRAHPNDGWLDVVEVSEAMSLRARWQAWRRLRTGGHVPHPDITTRRVRSESFDFDRALGVWVDGVARVTARSLHVEIQPDGAEIYV
jgi:YegS C-terminal NAD kinase beta sandwich-like domain